MACAEPRGGGQTNEITSPERLACCVDYYDKLSNSMADLVRLERLAKSVQDS